VLWRKLARPDRLAPPAVLTNEVIS
jgi:hypothetical protein